MPEGSYNVRGYRRMAAVLLAAGIICMCGCGSSDIAYETAGVFSDAVPGGSVDGERTFEEAADLGSAGRQQAAGSLHEDRQISGAVGDGQAAGMADDGRQPESGDTGSQNAGFTDESIQTAQTCYVYVCGAVSMPGVYEMDASKRLCDAVALAGGMTEEAEPTSLNLAAGIYDGMMLIVPTRQEWADGVFVTGEGGLPVREQSPASDSGLESSAAKQSDDGLVNINEATVEQLLTLPGIGRAKAESILAYRQEHGSFASIEEIQRVSGIKSALFEKIKNKIKI